MEMMWELSLDRKISSWLFTRKTWKKGHSGQTAQHRRRHGEVSAHLQKCQQFGWGDLKEQAEKWGGVPSWRS